MNKQEYSEFAIAGFVLSFFGLLAILGLICSVIGLLETKEHKKKGRGLAIAGLIISIIMIFLSLIIIVALLLMFSSQTSIVAQLGMITVFARYGDPRKF